MIQKDFERFYKFSLALWIRGSKVDNGAAFFIHGCCSNSAIEALLSTSTSRQRARKSRKSGATFSGFLSFGVPLVAIKYNAYNLLKF